MTNQPFFFPAILIGLASIPLALSLVPMNRFYGVRTPKTLSDSHVWLSANRFGGWLLLLSSVAYLVFAAICPMSGGHDPRFDLWLMHLGAFFGPVVISVAMTLWYVRRL